LAAPLDRHAGRESYHRGDLFFRLVDKAAEVATLYVGLHEYPQSTVLAGDFVGAEHALDARDLPERHVARGLAAGDRDGQRIEAFDIFAVGAVEAHLHGPALAPLDARGRNFAADAGLRDRE